MSDRLIVEVGEALFGSHYRLELAAALNVNERTVRRWADGTIDMPPGAALDCLRLTQERAAALDALAERLKIAAAP